MAKNDHPAVKGVDAREQAKEDSVADYYARQENLQPTPTQRENDLAKVGALNIDEKEDDGSEWEGDARRRVMEAQVNNPYDTRDLEAANAPKQQPKPSSSKKD